MPCPPPSLRALLTRTPLARTLLATPLLFAACLGPQPDQELHHYAVERAPVQPASEPAGTLRVRRLSAAGHLREPIAARTSEVSYEYMDAERWTEPPLGFVAVALDAALFESGAFTRGESGDASALDVGLLAFELQRSPSPAAVCTLAAQLTSSGGAALLDRSFEARVPVEDGSTTTLVLALGRALDQAVQQLALALAAADG